MSSPQTLARLASLVAATALFTIGGLAQTALAASAAPAASTAADVLGDLPAEVIGVIGSGDRLSLMVRFDGAGRTLAVGATYKDGWVLQALNPAEATLARNGAVRHIGLNPDGRLSRPAGADGPAARVDVLLSPADIASLQLEMARGRWDGKAAGGLSLAETQRYIVYSTRVRDRDNPGQADGVITHADMNMDAARELLGEAAYLDYLNLLKRTTTVNLAGAGPASIPGPTRFYLPAGSDPLTVMQAQGIDPQGNWSTSAPDASGGVTATRVTPQEAQAGWIQALITAAGG